MNRPQQLKQWFKAERRMKKLFYRSLLARRLDIAYLLARELAHVPYWTLVSYAEMSKNIDNPDMPWSAVRALAKEKRR